MSQAVTEQEISNEDYHALPGVSNSRLSDYIEDPKLYWYKYLSGRYFEPPKDHFDFGTAVHNICLQGDASNIVVIPPEALTKDGKRFGKAWDAFQVENEGKILLKQSTFNDVMECVRVVRSHKVAGELLAAPGPVEKLFSVYDEELGITRRCKPDKIVVLNGRRFVLDLKTTVNATPRSFVKAIVNFGYHRQEYFYRKVLEGLDVEVDAFVFIAVCDSKPHGVSCFTISSDFLDYAAKQVEPAIKSLAQRHRNNDWTTLSDTNVITLDPPNYIKYLGDYDL